MIPDSWVDLLVGSRVTLSIEEFPIEDSFDSIETVLGFVFVEFDVWKFWLLEMEVKSLIYRNEKSHLM